MRDNRCWLTQRTRAEKKKGRELKKQNATRGECLLASVVARGKSCFLISRRNGKQLLFERDRIAAVTRAGGRAVLAAAKAVAAATLPDDRRRCPRAISFFFFFSSPLKADLSFRRSRVRRACGKSGGWRDEKREGKGNLRMRNMSPLNKP